MSWYGHESMVEEVFGRSSHKSDKFSGPVGSDLREVYCTLKTVNVLLKLEPVFCESLETKVNRVRDFNAGRGCLFC